MAASSVPVCLLFISFMPQYYFFFLHSTVFLYTWFRWEQDQQEIPSPKYKERFTILLESDVIMFDLWGSVVWLFPLKSSEHSLYSMRCLPEYAVVLGAVLLAGAGLLLCSAGLCLVLVCVCLFTTGLARACGGAGLPLIGDKLVGYFGNVWLRLSVLLEGCWLSVLANFCCTFKLALNLSSKSSVSGVSDESSAIERVCTLALRLESEKLTPFFAYIYKII